ncbi:MAG: septal ring lytic transglycosylase RlpA family protein [Acetobacteraceae bacterium]
MSSAWLFAMAWIAVGGLLTLHPARAEGESKAGHRQQQGPGWVEEKGVASYYGQAHHGRRTASGKRFNQHELTAAHPWLPFGTRVRVTLAGGKRSVIVTITDRLYSKRRVVDLSLAAAQQLGIVQQGIAPVSLAPADAPAG